MYMKLFMDIKSKWLRDWQNVTQDRKIYILQRESFEIQNKL